MFRKIEDFKESFTYEFETTLKVFNNITDEAFLLKQNDSIRSIQRLVWHITITLGEMLGKAGLTIDCPDEHSDPLNDIKAICKTYETTAKSVLKEVGEKWTDESLLEEVEMYGDKWKKGTVLTVLIKHESHHRGQLTILMRLNNLKVPGVYGPSKEEWAAWNMAAPE
ncbi:MAG: hypothetical protein KAZ71_06780 [Bacteroidia bacterium]|nr:hypothetical protein [Bacteroidia bacterium]